MTFVILVATTLNLAVFLVASVTLVEFPVASAASVTPSGDHPEPGQISRELRELCGLSGDLSGDHPKPDRLSVTSMTFLGGLRSLD